MIPQWCALCLVGHSQAKVLLTLVDGNAHSWVHPLADAELICQAAGVKELYALKQKINLALTVYGGTPVCAWHLDEEIGRRRLCR